jgi:hypothetical protein
MNVEGEEKQDIKIVYFLFYGLQTWYIIIRKNINCQV